MFWFIVTFLMLQVVSILKQIINGYYSGPYQDLFLNIHADEGLNKETVIFTIRLIN